MIFVFMNFDYLFEYYVMCGLVNGVDEFVFEVD